MKHQKQLFTVLLMSAACMLQAQRSETLLEKNWKFSKGDFPEAVQTDYNDTKWESVVIPHDWEGNGRGYDAKGRKRARKKKHMDSDGVVRIKTGQPSFDIKI